MAFVIKISHGNTLRRLTMRKEDVGEGGIPFAKLESRVRELLQIPDTSKLSLTYTDAEGDVVTMANDQDVHDALFQQQLNPLRVNVSVEAGNVRGVGAEKPPMADNDVTIKQVLSKLSNPEIRKMLQSYLNEPLIEKISSPGQATAFVENLLRNVSTQVAAAVKHGADVASAAASPFGFVPGQSGGLSGTSSVSTSSSSSDSFKAAVAETAAKAEAAAKRKVDVNSVVHSGVSCDMCEMSPIVGLRYKSNKKFNYDLCSGCFEKHGKEEDFSKIEQSMFRPRHLLHAPGPHRVGPPFHPLSHPGFHARPFGMRGPFGRHHCHVPTAGGPPCGGKLDSRFVSDVTMFDGTEVAPKTNFTKIWRLRNSGTIPWPVRTNLVHVGGDELGQVSLVPVEIPPQGLAPEAEMEVAVDMVAPEKPGRYISHWRLASPAGPKFGHRIWVVIQVVANMNEEVAPSGVEEVGGENSAHDAEQLSDEVGSGAVDGEVIDVPVTSVVNVVVPTATEDSAKDNVADVQEKSVAPEAAPEADIAEGYAMVDIEPVASRVDKSEEEEDKVGETEQAEGEIVARADKSVVEESKVEEFDETPITYPIVDGIDVTRDEGPITYPVVESAPHVPEDVQQEGVALENVEAAVPEVGTEGENLKSAMAKLQTMGFTNSKLNLELLEKNNLDMRLTLNDLCAVEEWDPILEELEEMGFYDVDVNRRLMFKNNGSVKRVVKELVQMYRDLQGKGKNVEEKM